jgi:hypothetical protein
VGGSELLTRIDAPIFATKPFPVEQPRAGEMDDATAARKPLNRLSIQRLRISSVVQKRA